MSSAQPAKKGGAYGVSTDDSHSHRRKWDRNAFETMAHETIRNIRLDNSQTAAASMAADSRIDAAARVGTKTISKGPEGFRCEVCRVSFADYSAFLDHVNSWRHRKTAVKSLPKDGEDLSKLPITAENTAAFLDKLLIRKRLEENAAAEGAEDRLTRIETEKQQKNALKAAAKAQQKNDDNAKDDPLADEMRAAGFDFSAFK